MIAKAMPMVPVIRDESSVCITHSQQERTCPHSSARLILSLLGPANQGTEYMVQQQEYSRQVFYKSGLSFYERDPPDLSSICMAYLKALCSQEMNANFCSQP
jgi:hypothetical protein